MTHKSPVLAALINSHKTEPGVLRLWQYFLDICTIPHQSGNEEEIANYVISFARNNNLKLEKDKAGNVIIEIPATKGKESAPGIIFQGHLDMVCVGTPNPAKNGVRPIIGKKHKWLKAKETSLGADNGIGIAAALALAKEKITHGPIAILCTVDEEVGLSGAKRIDFQKIDLKKYHYLINLDSEEEGEATIGCAGGGDTTLSFPFQTESKNKKILLSIKVDKLMGGHSGVEIGENRLNAIKVLTGLVNQITKELGPINILSLSAGTARNVIPKKAEAIVALSPRQEKKIKDAISKATETIRSRAKYKKEKAMKITVNKTAKKNQSIMTKDSSQKVTRLLAELPHGVEKWSPSIKGLVETSTNLAMLETKTNEIIIKMMTRSSLKSELEKLRSQIEQVGKKYQAKINQGEAYPGWEPQPDNSAVILIKKAYKKLTEKSIKIKAIHAGLECGMLLEKYPHLEAISIGPTIKGAHSTEERVNVASVVSFYQFIIGIVTEVSSQTRIS